MSKKVYLSPSTQEKNIGALNYKTEEYEMNLVCDVIQKILLEHDVVVFRNKPTMSLAKVVIDSNTVKPDIHFAIHSNAGNKKVRGAVVYCYKFGSEGEKFAKVIYDKLSKITPVKDHGVQQGYNFYGIGKHMYEVAYTTAPACLAETSFHDNPDDAKWIMNNIDLIGRTYAEGILEFLNIPIINKPANEKKDNDCQWLVDNKITMGYHQPNEKVNFKDFSIMIQRLYNKLK